MNELTFNREHWLQKLLVEIGLSHVPYDELESYKIDFGFVVGSASDNAISAKQYIEKQLADIEKSYRDLQNIDASTIDVSQSTFAFHEVDVDNVLSQLNQVAGQLDNIETDNYAISNAQLLENLPEIKRENIHYYSVTIGDVEFVVAINDYGDQKIKDQIKHVINTSFFVEELSPLMLTGNEIIISYYQFTDAIEQYIRAKNTNASNLISKELKTEFQGGIKVDGF